jgi:hypothetical protein
MNLRYFASLFFLLLFIAASAVAENVTLIKPIDTDPCVPGGGDGYTIFEYRPTMSYATTCYLYSNQSGVWSVADTAYTVTANVSNFFNESFIPGKIFWGVRCSNTTSGIWDSFNFSFTLKNAPYCATLSETSCPNMPNIDGVGVFKTRLMNTKGMSLENQDCNIWIQNAGGEVVKAYNTRLIGHKVNIILDQTGKWVNTAEQKVPLTDSQGYYVFPFKIDSGVFWYGDTYTIYASCNGITTSCAFTTDKNRLPDVNNMEAFGREASGTIVGLIIIGFVVAMFGGQIWRRLRRG